MYWISKMHKNPIGAYLITASKIGSTKKISKSVYNIFNFVYSQIESFRKSDKFLSNYNRFWGL